MRGHMLPQVVALALGTGALVLPVLSFSADFESDKRDCSSGTGQVRINACTRLLRSGRFGARNRATTYYNRGNAYSRLRQHRLAIQDYDAALRLNPRKVEAYINRGFDRVFLKQYHQAIQDFDAGLRLNPRIAEAYLNRGVAYAALKQYRRAIQDFDETLRLSPRDPGAYINRGNSYEALGRRAEAIRDYQAALRFNPNHRGAREGLQRLSANPRQRPRGAAPSDTRPRCKDVGGYEAYMKRTGKVCRID